MKAPNLRSVVDIAMTIALSSVTGGVGGMLLNAALNMIDDAVFTMLDIANGMDPMDAVGALAKKAATSVVTSRISMGFSNAGGLLNSSMLGNGVIGKTLTKGLELTATNVASSAINSVNVKGLLTGGDAFDENAFKEGAFGKSAMTSVFAGMAGTADTTGFGTMMEKQSFVGYSQKYQGGVNALGGTLGNMASMGVTYGMTGRASMNLINTSMFGLKGKDDQLVNVGLFELGFGKGGISGSVSMGGTDMNLGRLASSFNGVNALYQNKRIEMSRGNNPDNSVLQRALFSYGDKKGRELYEASLSGKAVIEYGNTGDDGKGGVKLAETVKDKDGTYHIKLAQYGDNPMAQILQAVVMQHEAYRDGVQGSNQAVETEDAVRAHIGMAQRIKDDKIYASLIENTGFLNDELGKMSLNEADFSKYVAEKYDSSGDYWRVTKDKDGKVIKVQDDGHKDQLNYVDEEGNSLGSEELKEMLTTGGLVRILDNGQTKDDINKVFLASGLYRDSANDTKGWYARKLEGKYLGDQEYTRYSCQNYKEIARTEKERKDKVELKQLQDSPAGIQQDKIVNSLLSTITETWTNDCDTWVYKNFLQGGQDLALLMGDDGLTANEHYLEGQKNGIWSEDLTTGLNVMIVDFGTNGQSDGTYDHISSIYLSPDGQITIYNHGTNEPQDKKPYPYINKQTFNKSTAWGYRRYYNPWRIK